MSYKGMSSIQRFLAKANARMEFRNKPVVAWRSPKKCGALARSTGKPCRRKALLNGRCRNHGGMSTGPITEQGKARSLANLKQFKSATSTVTEQGYN
jgi:hypothetical protein